MDDVVIRVENLSKRYRIGAREKANKTFRETMMDMAAAPFRRVRKIGRSAPPEETIWALKDVSLEVKRGEVLGIIGRNGAGKSTLLKILSRITEPTGGRVEIRGRLASLLEVGTGFHEELTGRENIYLNGAILGMKKAEIDRNFDEIVAFSEIEKFIDTPVKRYSSGMHVRLAFAVAAHLEPEILLVDEVLAVGDAQFQKKCLGKMGEVARGGRTVLFVSHNMAAVINLCNRAVLIDAGRLVDVGEADRLVQTYLGRTCDNCGAEVDLTTHPGRPVWATPVLRRVRLSGADGQPRKTFRMGEAMTISVSFKAPAPLASARIGLGLNSSYGQRVFTVLSSFSPDFVFPSGRKEGTVHCAIDQLPLCAGLYSIKAAIAESGVDLDAIEGAIEMEVVPDDVYGSGKIPGPAQGLVYLKNFAFKFDGNYHGPPETRPSRDDPTNRVCEKGELA